MKWTEEQSRAIYSHTSRLLVAAAAGSGKTAVLSERIIEYLRAGGEISKVLVVTFTNAAAEEMRGRIRKKIRAEQEIDLESAAFWQRQYDQLEWASIQTFHSFCKKVIDQNLYLMPFDKGYALIQVQERMRIRNEEIRQVLETYYGSEKQNIQAIFSQYRTPKSDRKIIGILDRYQSFLQGKPGRQGTRVTKAGWEDLLRTEMLIALESLDVTLAGVAEICGQAGGPSKYGQAIEADRALVKEIYAKMRERDYRGLGDLPPLKFKRFQAIKKTEMADLDVSRVEAVKKTRTMTKKLIKKWLTEFLLPLADWKGHDLMGKQTAALFDLARAFDQSLRKRKIEDHVLDFDDLETYAYQLLGTPSVAGRYQERYDQIFVDEYQDTSYMQEAVLACIQGSNQLFFVGDGKQSIYQFRGATPRLFLAKIQEESQGFDTIRLNQNFRSSPMVIDGVNAFFNQRMTKEFGGVDYEKTDQLKAGGLCQGAQKPVFAVVKDSGGLEAEVEWVAEQIETLLDQGHLPQTIAVLARSLQPIQESLRSVFQERGIPLQTSQQFDSRDAVAIQMFQAFLMLMNGGVSDEALLAVMRFPQWKFSPEDLSRIRIAYPQGRFEWACRRYGKEVAGSIAKKLQAFYDEIDGMREKSCQMPLSDFLEAVLEWRNFADSILAIPDGLQKNYGLRAYVAELQNRVSRSSLSLHRLCLMIQEEKREGISTMIPSVQGDQGVRLMTIHGSKGLEFETVFLINTSQAANLFDLNQSVLIHEDFGLAMTVYDTSAGAIQIPLERRIGELVVKRQRVSEELRIYYVGMTRAIDRLFVIAHDNNPAKTRGNSHYLKTVSGGLDFPSLYHWMVGAGMHENENWTYQEVTLRASEKQVVAKNLADHMEIQLSQEVQEIAVAYEKERPEMIKVNLTEWIRRGGNKPMVFEENTMAIDRGNAFHEVLEKITLTAYKDLDSVEVAISDLNMSRRITDQTRALIEPERLLDWTRSSLGKRILSADQVLREKAFIGALPVDAEARYAQGKIDCLFREGDNWVVVDYKMRFSKDMDSSIQQVQAYARIIRECFDMTMTEAYLYEWETGQTLQVDLD